MILLSNIDRGNGQGPSLAYVRSIVFSTYTYICRYVCMSKHVCAVNAGVATKKKNDNRMDTHARRVEQRRRAAETTIMLSLRRRRRRRWNF